ncbi:MAG: hypothetical protein P9M14_13355 [Candidatus Alcyoniella australis]|nr:hypothetical protein [Candidatus Alcyoniella australis]
MKLELADAQWIDHPANPLIEPPRPQWMIADPTLLPPQRTHDGRWQMIANSVGFLNRYVSDDGIAWERCGKRLCRGIRPHIFRHEKTYHLFYELHTRPWLSGIYCRTSQDLQAWSEPRPLLIAGHNEFDGRAIRFLGNPCMVQTGDEFRLYFSSGWIWLWDCLYFEPEYIGVATSQSIDGPFTRRPGALLGPQPDNPLLNFGAGSIKVLNDGEGGWWVFNNGIYRDAQGKSRSAIVLMHSADGFEFRQVSPEPIVAPEPGWKNAFVYAFDPVVYGDELRLYYNARDGWFRGSERIGLATAKIST